MEKAVSTCDAAITTGDASLVPDAALSIGPDHRSPDFQRLAEEPESQPAQQLHNGVTQFDADFSNGERSFYLCQKWQ